MLTELCVVLFHDDVIGPKRVQTVRANNTCKLRHHRLQHLLTKQVKKSSLQKKVDRVI